MANFEGPPAVIQAMTSFHSTRIVLVAGALALACDGGTTTPEPTSLPSAAVVVRGDNQVQFVGTRLIDDVAVTVVDADGVPVAMGGLAVQWRVLEGGGFLIDGSATTDSNGVATTRWIVGPEPGTNRATATIGDLSPVEFTARGATQGPIVFVSSRHAGFRGNDFEGFPGDLFAMNEDGSDVIRIVSVRPELNYSANPAWAPDRSGVLFSLVDPRPAGGVPGAVPLGIFKIAATGFDEKQLPNPVFPSEVSFLQDPDWSPDGTRIVAHSALDRKLYTFNYRNTSAFAALTDFGESAHSPSWSPDTLEIAFACTEGGRTDICVLTRADGRIRNLTSDAAEDGEPDWAPDGSKLLFSRDSLTDGGIWMMNPNGSGLEQIVEGKATSPSWAPDGTRFVMTFEELGRTDIYVVDLATREKTNLTNSGSLDRQAVWRR